MLSYSRCCDFYKCPWLFQNHDDYELHTKAIELGSQIDTMLNCLMIKHIENPDFRKVKAAELGVSDMLQAIVDSKDMTSLFDVPACVKYWYINFVSSGYKVLDIQKHFVLPDLDYHGYIDAVIESPDGDKVVVENKTTSNYKEDYFASKSNSFQVVGYSLAEGTDLVRYNFFNTRTLTEYTPYSRQITSQDIEEFTQWVNFVRQHEDCMVKNREYCSLMNCPIKEECWGL